MKKNNNFQKIFVWCFILLLVFPISLIQIGQTSSALAAENEFIPTNGDDSKYDECMKNDSCPAGEIKDDDQQEPAENYENDSVALDQAAIERKGWEYLAAVGKVPRGLLNIIDRKNQLTEMIEGGNFDKIYFENPIDEFAIFGEPCRRPGLTKAGGWLVTADQIGQCDQWIKDNPADDIFPNGVWDGPHLVQDPQTPKGKITQSIVDGRVIEVLNYLTTPTWRGGAGRERITVKKIVQFNENDREQVKEKDEGGEEPVPQKSAHYIGEIREGRRIDKTIQAIDISEIDSIRIISKITKKKRVGGDKTTYKFQRPFGVKVAWQDDYGLNRAGVPPVDVLTGAKDFFKAGILNLLSDMELTEALKPEDLSDVDLRDLAAFIGSEVLASILNSPRGSLSGFDLEDVLEKFGRSVIADELKLPRQAFDSGNSIDDIERNVGQAILEKKFSLPKGAFAGNTSSEIISSIGRRWLEDEIFQVRPGTLDYQLRAGEVALNKFYERLGAGRLEWQFNFKPGVFDGNDFVKIKEQGGLRFNLIFDDKNDANVDEMLGLTLVRGDVINPDGLRPDDPNTIKDPRVNSTKPDAAKGFRTKQISPNEFKNLIGRRVLEQSIQILNTNLPTDEAADAQIAAFVRGNQVNLNERNIAILTAARGNIVSQYRAQIDSGQQLLGSFLNDYMNLKVSLSVKIDNAADPLMVVCSSPYNNLNNASCPKAVVSDSAVVEALNQISQALNADLKIINNGLRRANEDNNLANRTKIIEALEGLRQKNFQYLEAVYQAQAMGGKTSSADQAMALTASPFLVQAGYNNQSLVNRLLLGDLSIIPTIGLLKLSQKTTNNTEEQAAIQVNLFERAQSLFDTAAAASEQFGLGLSEVRIRGRFGLVSGDYDRIFVRNMGEDVFRRIGKAELLAAVWRQPDFQAQVQRLRQNETYQDIEQLATEAQNELGFYTSRLNDIASIYQNQIVAPIGRLVNLDDDTKRTINQKIKEMYPAEVDKNLNIDFVQSELQRYYRSVHISSVGGAFEFLAQTERYVSIIIAVAQILNSDGRTKGTNDANTVWQAVNQIRHKLQEISAGRQLQYETPDNLQVDPLDIDYSQSDVQKRQSKCWSAGQLIAILAPAGERNIGSNLENGLKTVGACELDKRLTLPIGSLYGFYKSGDHGFDSFKYQIGAASFKERGLPVLSDDSQVREEGRNVLTGRILQKLTMQSGLFRSISQKYPLTGETIWLLVMGDEKAAAVKFGGSLIDSRLHLTPGTTAELVDPCAATEILAARGVQCASFSAKEREEIRAHVLAREGLRQLGLELDIPLGVDFTQGNFRDNLGRNQFESVLGLKSFQGQTLNNVIQANGVDTFINGIGAPPTPYMALLTDLKLKVREELNKVNPSDTEKKVEFQVLTSELNNIYQREQNNLLNELRSATENHYYWWTDTSSPPLSALDEDSTPIGDEFAKIQSLHNQLSGRLSASAQNIINQAKKLNKDQLAAAMRSNAIRFQYRLEYLNRRLFDLSGPNNNIDPPKDVAPLSMKAIIQGTTNKSPDQLNEDFGKVALWHLGVQITEQKFGDTFIGQIIKDYKQFREIVGTNEVPEIEKIFSGDANIDWNMFSKGDGIGIKARTWFFDRFLAHSFSAKFDEKMGFEVGTVRNLFAKPHLAREIMIDQGMNRLATEFFRADQTDSNEQREVKYSLMQIFNAGFLVSCSTSNSELPDSEIKNGCKASDGRDFYSLTFRRSRAIGQFRSLINAKLQTIVDDEATPYLGTTIPLSDLNALVHGDLRTLGFIAAAYTIKQVNTGDNGNPIDRSRLVDYNIARLATVGDPNAPAVIAAGSQATAVYRQNLVNAYCERNNISCNDDNALYAAMATRNGTTVQQTQIDFANNSQAAKKSAEDQAFRELRDRAMKIFQYRMMDAALWKLDANIPIGFAEAFFGTGATEESRNDAALLVLVNHLTADRDSEWSEFFNVFRNERGELDFIGVRSFRQTLDNLSCDTDVSCRQQFFSTILTTEGLKNYVKGVFNNVFKDSFGTILEDRIFDGLLAWGITGKLDGSYQYNGKDGKPMTIRSLSDSVEKWAADRLLSWVDRSIGFQVGTARQLYDTGHQLYDAYKKYDYIRSHNDFEVGLKFGDQNTPLDQLENKGGEIRHNNKTQLKEAQAAFITFAVTTIFKSQIASMENKLGLVPGTGAMAVGMLINLAVGVPIDPITIALFIGLNLFGVYKIEIDTRGTADGYYPLKGQYGDYTYGGVELETSQIQTGQGLRTATKQRRVNFQYPSPDPPIGEFEVNSKNNASYKEGLKNAAVAKIEGLLIDLATAPERWAVADANKNKLPTYDLMPSQVFTKLPEHIDAVQAFISRSPCRSQANVEQNGGCGYGPVEERKYSGFWANADSAEISFWDHIHVAW